MLSHSVDFIVCQAFSWTHTQKHSFCFFVVIVNSPLLSINCNHPIHLCHCTVRAPPLSFIQIVIRQSIFEIEKNHFTLTFTFTFMNIT